MRVALLLTLTLLPLISRVAAQPLPASYAPVSANAVLEAELLRQTNRAREAQGLAPLRQNEGLALAARQHALEMATLNYFAHTSPTEVNATVSRRVARAGSPLVTVGENLAKVGDSDVARVTTEGWLNSPGHRENLLNPAFTHVGFGTARAASGQTLVAQVFAYAPVTLRSASVRVTPRNFYDLTLDVRLDEAREGLFTVGEDTSELLGLSAGRQGVNLQTEASGRIHLRGAVRAPSGGGFIVEDSGWLELANGRYTPDRDVPKRALSILGVQVAPRSGHAYEVELTLDPSERELALFLDEVYVEGAEVAPGRFRVSVPVSVVEPELAVGSLLEGGRVEVLMILSIDSAYGEPRLVPRQF